MRDDRAKAGPVVALDVETLPLRGRQLIEASAGTGKTWTLAALYVRLVLGHRDAHISPDTALMPEQILVMTFTEAATAELRARVRERLAQAAQVLGADGDACAVGDAFLLRLREAIAPHQWGHCAQRLQRAAQSMDQAAIHTIHGWSARMLQSHALGSASPFLQQHLEDPEALRLELTQDYWRQWIYTLDAEQLRSLEPQFRDPASLVEALNPLWKAAQRAPDARLPTAPAVSPMWAEWRTWHTQVQQREDHARALCTEALLAELHQTVESKALKGYRKTWPGDLQRSLAGERLLMRDTKEREKACTALQRFTRSALKQLQWQGADGPAYVAFEALFQALMAGPDVRTAMLAHAASTIEQAYGASKECNAQFDFFDLLARLYRAVAAPDGCLARTLAREFPVALVDEFQDTDPWQYGTLARIYARDATDTGLILIGDPKQAIYGFRGADLNTYLAARHDVQGIYTLSGNYRSTPALVRATNHVFACAHQPFGEVPFVPAIACAHAVSPPQRCGQPLPAFQVCHVVDATPGRVEDLRNHLGEHAASQIVDWLRTCVAPPGDMAVLVRSGSEARAVRAALAKRGVRSVYLSERDSVYAAPEAVDCWRLLRAVANPRDGAAVRAVLASWIWCLSWDTLEHSLEGEGGVDVVLESFFTWQQVWRRHGVLAMMHRVLHDAGLAERLLREEGLHPNGERALTNLMHLGELLQQASMQLQGENALIRYLEQRMRNPRPDHETAQLRLESDAQLVQVVTIHKSKGLQYPLVLLPFVSLAKASAPEVGPSGEDGALAEEVRLMYVALTRAQRAAWMLLTSAGGERETRAPTVRSAVSWLLQRQAPDDLLQCLQRWAACPDIVVQEARETSELGYTSPAPETDTRAALAMQGRPYDTPWNASFSALTHAVHTPLSRVSPRDARRDHVQQDFLQPEEEGEPGASRYQCLPAGAELGSAVHELLQWQWQHGWPLAATERDAAWETTLAQKAQRLALSPEDSDLLHCWLKRLCTATLLASAPVNGLGDVGLSLAQLRAGNSWAEMAFLMPVSDCSAQWMDARIQAQVLPGYPRPALQPVQLHGMLCGSMDMVLQHEGRYYVLDYKSNRLDGYDAACLRNAWLAHRYDVQAAVYVLALHRLLKARLPAYHCATHLGGALFWFLRGVDAPGSGVLSAQFSADWIHALDQALLQPRGSP